MDKYQRRQRIRRRARNIRKASSKKLTRRDYIQRTIVVLVIVAILAAALYLTGRVL